MRITMRNFLLLLATVSSSPLTSQAFTFAPTPPPFRATTATTLASTVVDEAVKTHAAIESYSEQYEENLEEIAEHYPGKEEEIKIHSQKVTGTSFLPEETMERVAKGSPVEKVKAKGDPGSIYVDVYEFARKIREGEMTWKEVEKADLETRLKWVGMIHRGKRTPGQFLMRLKVPNGIVNSDHLRFYADCVEKYGTDFGVVDITTRQNMQMRGIKLEDADDVIDGLHARNQTSFMSALDNVRNMVGSPLAGIDPLEQVDTRPYCNNLNDLISLDPVTGTRGNPQWGNLPRKFNIAVSGSRDDFAHTDINDIGLQPCAHAVTGEMGFNLVLGGYMSIKRVAHSIDSKMWVKADLVSVNTLCEAILRLFRDEGERKDRQKARVMWLVEKYGVDDFKKAIIKEIDSYDRGVVVEDTQPKSTEPFERRDLLGVHEQKQKGLYRVGILVPVGRLSATECRQLADLAERYSGSEVRCTVEQNVLLPNVLEADVPLLLAEPTINGVDSRMKANPGKIEGGVVSCTGAEFCGFAMVETKHNAERVTKLLEELVVTPEPMRIHWTGCPNSCGQVQVADIGIMGAPARKEVDGKKMAVPGCKIFVGGRIGEDAHLALEPTYTGIPLEDESLIPLLVKIIKSEFKGVDRAPDDISYSAAGRSPEATALAALIAAEEAAAPVEPEAPELSKEEKKAKWLADKAAKKAGGTAVAAPVEMTKAEKKEKWLADKAAKKAAEAAAKPELTKAEKKEQWLKERDEKKAAAAAKKEEDTKKAPVAKTEEVKKPPATPKAEVKKEEKKAPAAPVAVKQEETKTPVSVSHDEDLLLTLQVIMAHDIRSTTHSKEQFIHDLEQPVIIHEKTIDVLIPYMATAKLAFEQSEDTSMSYEDFEKKYLADAVQEVMAKQ
mmetsp:Transcript_8971/g.10392  ORF Transcript_8971/g.10392 Transcript_8971/m.10392 type:complete len:894 (-) Transcript_8971:355-3036(-)